MLKQNERDNSILKYLQQNKPVLWNICDIFYQILGLSSLDKNRNPTKTSKIQQNLSAIL